MSCKTFHKCRTCMSTISRTGGTAGWLLNLRPGTRGYGHLRQPTGQRVGRPGHVTALRPSARSLLPTWSTTPSYTAVRLPASRWSTCPAFHEAGRASTTGRSQSRIMDIPGGRGLAEDPARRYWNLGRHHPSQLTRTRNLRLWEVPDSSPTFHSRLGT